MHRAMLSPIAVSSPNFMLRSAALCFLFGCTLLWASAAANAGEIHKCVTPTAIAYQSAPCSGAELPTSAAVAMAVNAAPSSLASSARPPSPPDTDPTTDTSRRGAPSCGPRPREPRRLPWRQATICIGMTDDEVLNLPEWGRPAKITRTHAPREWREHWLYDARFAGPRQLSFVNGTLTEVETEFVDTPAGRIATLGSAPDGARTATN
jgi:hypothetical protein